MAVQKVKARKQVNFALPIVEKKQVLPYFFTTVGKENFVGAKGDTVNFKVTEGSIATARDYDFRGRTGPIVLDDIYQQGGNIPIKLNTHVVSATALEDEHFTLDDIDFAREVVAPQAEAVADRIEAKALAALRGTTSIKHSIEFEANTDDPHTIAAEAKRLMDSEKVAPYNNRIFLVGNDLAAAWRNSERLSNADLIDSVAPAVRDAVIGRLSGSLVIEHNGLLPGEGYYLHGTSFILASAAPDVPRGATYGMSGRSKRGLALRFLQDYDPNYLRDRAITSTFVGVNEVRDERDANGNWIVEEGEFDEEDLAVMRNNDGSEVTPVPVGTRKNVRIIKLVPTFANGGSLLA